ncbi:MAG: UbiA-like protein EboC [Balneolaceae bacterium]|nr:UbiA-like protein EboC [Balneolaceae bacterium]
MAISDNPSDHSLGTKIPALLEVMRPANIVTAFADILAGFAIAGGAISLVGSSMPSISPEGLGWLLLSTFGLYGGGVVFNDYFDADLDAEERPERPIPSGRISPGSVALLGSLLLLLGIVSAFQVNAYSLVLAILIAGGSLVYDKWAKHSKLWGPLLMGLLRGWNLLLGCSIVPITILLDWYLPVIPIAYIGAITLISQGEVHGGTQKTGFTSMAIIGLIIGGLLSLGLQPSYNLMMALPFIIIFGITVLPPSLKPLLIQTRNL